MVNFKLVPLPDLRITPEIRARFLNVAQLKEWQLTESSGTYTGLVVHGEKAIPQGFQSMAEISVDIPPAGIPDTKIQEISQIVQSEFVKRAVILLKK
jgi:hypothetical protein